MSEFENFISSLSDHELAIFYGYRYDGFLENSQKTIDTEIRNRNLSPERLKLLKDEKIIYESKKQVRTCPRCGSEKLFVETDLREIPYNEFASKEIATDSYRCRLCGYNGDKATPKNFLERIKRVFKKGTNRRINKWNEIYK